MRVTPEYVSDGANAPRRRDGKNSDSTDTDFDRAVAQELQRRQDLLADAVDHLGPLIAVLRKLKEGGMEVSMRLDPPPTMDDRRIPGEMRSEEHTSEIQSLMSIAYADVCLKNKKT